MRIGTMIIPLTPFVFEQKNRHQNGILRCRFADERVYAYLRDSTSDLENENIFEILTNFRFYEYQEHLNRSRIFNSRVV